MRNQIFIDPKNLAAQRNSYIRRIELHIFNNDTLRAEIQRAGKNHTEN